MKIISVRTSALSVAIGSLLGTGSLSAAMITVTTVQDGAIGTPVDECTLRSAVATANTGTPYGNCTIEGDMGEPYGIQFDPALSGLTIALSEGQMQISSEVTIAGPVPGDPASLTIDASGGASRIFEFVGPGGEVDFNTGLENLTLTGGTTTGGGVENYGGAVRAFQANLFIENSLITGNATEGDNAGGGGVSVLEGNLVINNSTIENNLNSGYSSTGGGIDVRLGDATITNSLLAGNSTTGAGYANGAGLFINNGVLTVVNSTISGNVAGEESFGGGIGIVNATAELTHSTIAYNTALNLNDADGIWGGGTNTLTLSNSLIVQGEGELACDATIPSSPINTLATDGSCTGTATALADIGLQELADNGGLTRTHALGEDSVAIDQAGDCQGEFGITTDQRGRDRPGAGSSACDIGAYELQTEDEIFADRFEAET